MTSLYHPTTTLLLPPPSLPPTRPSVTGTLHRPSPSPFPSFPEPHRPDLASLKTYLASYRPTVRKAMVKAAILASTLTFQRWKTPAGAPRGHPALFPKEVPPGRVIITEGQGKWLFHCENEDDARFLKNHHLKNLQMIAEALKVSVAIQDDDLVNNTPIVLSNIPGWSLDSLAKFFNLCKIPTHNLLSWFKQINSRNGTYDLFLIYKSTPAHFINLLCLKETSFPAGTYFDIPWKFLPRDASIAPICTKCYGQFGCNKSNCLIYQNPPPPPLLPPPPLTRSPPSYRPSAPPKFEKPLPRWPIPLPLRMVPSTRTLWRR